jgi:hypothetical protein
MKDRSQNGADRLRGLPVEFLGLWWHELLLLAHLTQS